MKKPITELHPPIGSTAAALRPATLRTQANSSSSATIRATARTPKVHRRRVHAGVELSEHGIRNASEDMPAGIGHEHGTAERRVPGHTNVTDELQKPPKGRSRMYRNGKEKTRVRKAPRLAHLETLIREFFDEDVAEAVISSAGWDEFCTVVDKAVVITTREHDADNGENVVGNLAYELTDSDLNWILGDTEDGSCAEDPAAYLASRVREWAGIQ